MQDLLFERVQSIINSDDEIVKIFIETLNNANIELGVKINLHELIKTILLLPFKRAAFKGGVVIGTAAKFYTMSWARYQRRLKSLVSGPSKSTQY